MKKETTTKNAAVALNDAVTAQLVLIGQVKDIELRGKILMRYLSVLFDTMEQIQETPNTKKEWCQYHWQELTQYLDDNAEMFGVKLINDIGLEG